MSRIIDLSLLIEDNMPAHKLFQRPVYAVHMTHESAKAHNLGVPGDAMTFQTNFIAMVDHVGTHVDAFRHVSPNGKSVDEMPLDLFMGRPYASICGIFPIWARSPSRIWSRRRPSVARK
jgi:kynurenine formamidase